MRAPILRPACSAAFLGVILGCGVPAAADPIIFTIKADVTGSITGPSGTQPLSGPFTMTFEGDTSNVKVGNNAFIDSFATVGFDFSGVPGFLSVDPENYALSNVFNTVDFFIALI